MLDGDVLDQTLWYSVEEYIMNGIGPTCSVVIDKQVGWCWTNVFYGPRTTCWMALEQHVEWSVPPYFVISVGQTSRQFSCKQNWSLPN